jgi:hypothetical protein
VTASEFSFLALGLVLGLVTGAALIELVRARPPSRREVRLTVSHDAIPRRAATLADDAFISVGPEPARGGPADRRLSGFEVPAGAGERRTDVRFVPAGPALVPSMAGAIPIGPIRDHPVPARIMEPALPFSGDGAGRATRPQGEAIGISVEETEASSGRGIAEWRPPWETASTARPEPATAPGPNAAATHTAVALLDAPRAKRTKSGAAASERCVEERRLADERCELATLARGRADVAVDTLRAAQRAYDGHEAAAVTAAWRADPRAVHDAKDQAQGGFRAAVAAASSPEQLEVAARDWLTEINRINTQARDATVSATREHNAALAIGATLERLGLEADAARIGAENADVACLAARVAVAECDEGEAAGAATDPDQGAIATFPPAMPSRLEEDETLGQALEAGGEPLIFRALRGERQAMTSLVAALAGDDPEARRRWQLQITNLLEAIIADAIEASVLEFPDEHAFWGEFTRPQARDVVEALSSLGYRFDGLGSWADGRQPSQRDLSLALGYAGLDPKRVRHWPSPEAIADLFADVAVGADEHLASVAGDLTLAEMVAMLGRRADGLAEIWNHWGQVRPLLLDER